MKNPRTTQCGVREFATTRKGSAFSLCARSSMWSRNQWTPLSWQSSLYCERHRWPQFYLLRLRWPHHWNNNHLYVGYCFHWVNFPPKQKYTKSSLLNTPKRSLMRKFASNGIHWQTHLCTVANTVRMIRTILSAETTVAPVTSSCVDKLNPATGVSDCPSRAYLCNNSVYYTLMTEVRELRKNHKLQMNLYIMKTSTSSDYYTPMTLVKIYICLSVYLHSKYVTLAH